MYLLLDEDDELDELDDVDEYQIIERLEVLEAREQVEIVEYWISLFLNDNKMKEKLSEVVPLYAYVKNWKIICSWTNPNLKIWKRIEVPLPWYYRINEKWELVMAWTDNELSKDHVFIWSRDWKEYYDKRIEAVWWKKLEDTRVHDELKEETDENPTPENHSESEE